MKKIIILLSLILALVFIFGCGENAAPSGKTDIEVYTVSDLDSYIIVRAAEASAHIIESASKLQSELLKKTGAKVQIKNDSEAEKSKEIIIGDTAREIKELDTDDLKPTEFFIKKIGNKIVIAGGSDRAVSAGVDFLINHFIVDNAVKAPVNGYRRARATLVDSISVEGNSIANYTVVSDLYDITVAEELAVTIEEISGYSIPVVSAGDFDPESGKYILLDDTNTDFDTYSVTVEDGNITFFANYVTIKDCIDYFLCDMLKLDIENNVANGGRDPDIKADMSRDFTVENTPIYSKDKLYEVLETVYNDDDSLIIGQQITEIFHPVGEAVTTERAQYKKECGVDVPMLGYDLGTLEYKESRRTENGVIKEAYDLIQFMRDGGIVTFSLHLDNPGPQRDSVDHYRGELAQTEWDQLLTAGTDINKNFMETLEFIGDFLEIFKINNAPVIFRPLHEINGNWFWFCIRSGPDNILLPQSYAKDLWVLMYNYFVNERGVDNMLWEFSPNVMDDPEEVIYCYPGDEYCDLVSLDWYTDSYSGHDILSVSEEALKETGKIFSVSEFGPGGDIVTNLAISDEYKFNCVTLDEVITEVRDDGIKMAYLLLWSSYAEVKISMWNMGGADVFYKNNAYLTLEDTFKLLYE